MNSWPNNLFLVNALKRKCIFQKSKKMGKKSKMLKIKKRLKEEEEEEEEEEEDEDSQRK